MNVDLIFRTICIFFSPVLVLEDCYYIYVMFSSGDGVLFLSDSMAKHVPPPPNGTVQAYSGSTADMLLEKLADSPELVHNYQIIVIHVGTNHFGSPEEWRLYQRFSKGQLSRSHFEYALRRFPVNPDDHVLQNFGKTVGDILDFIQMVNPECIILVSAILPRVWDHHRRHHVRLQFNDLLRGFNSKLHNRFYINSDNPFLYRHGGVKVELFRPDGLHLADRGVQVFKSFLCEKVDKARRGFLC